MDRLQVRRTDWLRTPAGQAALVIGMLIFMLGNGLLSLRNKTLTYDEPKHLGYGIQILHLDSDRSYDSTMPVSAWNALPGRVGEFLPESKVAFAAL